MSDISPLAFGHFRVALHPDGTPVELGRGAMGVTYKAFDERLRIDVALKLITPAQIENPRAQNAFLREARAAARVHQTNVANVVYLNDTPGNFFYAMEFVEGQPLRDWMRAHPAPHPLAVIGIALQIARGLEAIHEQQIVHRDLKPTNVMMVKAPRTSGGPWNETDPDAWKAKIIDFGLARAVVPEPGSGTQSAGFHGTALYASPEQCEERPDIDGRSDLYSLGCIIWEMLCGAPPFHARTHRELLNKHVAEPPPMERIAHVPPSLGAIIARLLIKNPENRFPNATALIKALERSRDRIASGQEEANEQALTTYDPSLYAQSDAARPATSPPSTSSGSRRDLWTVAAAVLALVIPALFFFTYRGAKIGAPKPKAPSTASPVAPAAKKQKIIAFLPFENRSSDPEAEGIADGVILDVIDNIGKFNSLRTVSRTAMNRYRGKSDIDLRQIAIDNLIDAFVEGVVQVSGDRIKLSVSLVEPQTQQAIWTRQYERRIDDKFKLQSEIAIDIAESLKASLDPAGRIEVNRPLSDNALAMKAYFLGRGLMSNLSDEKNLKGAIDALKEAVLLDPSFAQAHAQLAILLSTNYDWGSGRTPEEMALARNAAETALRLQPNLPEAQMAMGVYAYRVLRDFAMAQPLLERALAGMPGNTEALFELASMERRQGKWTSALEKLRGIALLLPNDTFKQYALARTYLYMHRYEEAWRILQPALQRSPTDGFLRTLEGELFATWKSDLGPMRDYFQIRPTDVPDKEGYIVDKVTLKLFERKFDDALRILRESDFKIQQGHSVYVTRDALEAEILTQAGRLEEARPIWRRVAADLKTLLDSNPGESAIRKSYALALAASGDDAMGAVREARRAADEVSVAKDAMDGSDFQLGLALVLLRTGDVNGAVEIVKRIRAMPSIIYDSEFNLSPAWDAIHRMPGIGSSTSP